MSAAGPLQNLVAKQPTKSNSPHAGLRLQRKCACGSPRSSLAGEIAECSSKKRLRTKLAIAASNDPLEREADCVADQVLAASVSPDVRGSPPRIQRFVGHPSDAASTTPASVERVLESCGWPLGTLSRRDMERSFGRDFSRVRGHSGTAAEQSAQDAHAYTEGQEIVFGSGCLAPGTYEGRRLIAQELAHLVQQVGTDGMRASRSDEKRSVPGFQENALGRWQCGYR